MAQGLRCPNCGHKHPLSELPGTPTFRCDGCGQVLKTPSAYRDHAAEDGAPRRTTAPSAPSAYRRPASRVPPGSRGSRYFGSRGGSQHNLSRGQDWVGGAVPGH